MMISHPIILKCPYCGGLRRIYSIRSGNTIGRTLWSDYKVHLPMLPHVSNVLRCPVCKRYHFYDSSQIVGECRSWGNASWGNLSYWSLKEAMEQLKPVGNDEMMLRMLIHWAYNDLYWKMSELEYYTDDFNTQRPYFIQNALRLISLNPDKPLFCAELYREIGDFDECLKLLSRIKKEDLSAREQGRVVEIKEKAEKQDSMIYAIIVGRNNPTRIPILNDDDTQYIYDPNNDPEEKDLFSLFDDDID